AHLTVALWYISRHTADSALVMLRDRIRRYNEAVGVQNTDTGGYHETLTRIFVNGIAAFLSHCTFPGTSIATLHALLDSELADKKWPLRFYSRERINSTEARRGWIEPDLNPMPEIGQRMKRILHVVDAFTDKPFAGNPAAVCILDAPADETWMKQVARE